MVIQSPRKRRIRTVARHAFGQVTDFVMGPVTNAGLWFLFFLVIYIILVLKTVTYGAMIDNIFFGFYSFLITIYILSRFLLSYFHREIPADLSYKPTISFIVPAKNEEENIRETILRFAEVNYPKELIEVIMINDGSTDRTYRAMCAVAKEISPVIQHVEVVNWVENKGKRHGMAEGVKRASNEIMVFVDSDSFIEPDCVTHLVKYFSNPEVGSVSGHTDVHNTDTNMLTKMQAVRYYIAFKIYKAAESVFGTVTCCPGCCSAYRRAYLLPFLDEWLEQRFLGAPCTFGDDRSLTNYIIKNYLAVYSPEAKATTVVPDQFGKYFRQQQRWKKSWVRETFLASLFMWRKNPLAVLSFYSYVFLALASPVVFVRAVFWHPIQTHEWPIVYLLGLMLMLLLHGVYYRIAVGRRSWFLPIMSFWFHSVILIWQLPWAVITIRDSRWGTR